MNHPRIFLDLDGVMVDLLEGAYEFHKLEDPYNDPDNHGKYDHIHDLVGMDEKKFWDPLGHDFWASLPPTEEAHELMDMLLTRFRPEWICFLTAPTKHPGSCSGKHEWITTNFPAFERSFLIGPPKFFCSHPKALLIDDNESNAKAFAKAGGTAILYPRPWNSLHLKSWSKESRLGVLERGLSRFMSEIPFA